MWTNCCYSFNLIAYLQAELMIDDRKIVRINIKASYTNQSHD